MQGKNIKVHLKRKIGDWVSSVDDETIKDAISDNAIITGGAIVSLLQDEKPHDYDVYFRNEKALIQVAEYYVKKYTEFVKEKLDDKGVKPTVQRCYWNKSSER